MAFEATLGTLYRWADKVLRLDDTPPRLAAAYAWGIVAGFSPFFVIQYVVAFAAAFVLRLNKLLVLAGLCTNLPWIMVPWYTATTAIAGALLGVPLPADLRGEFVPAVQPVAAVVGLPGTSCSRWCARGSCRSSWARPSARSCSAWRSILPRCS